MLIIVRDVDVRNISIPYYNAFLFIPEDIFGFAYSRSLQLTNFVDIFTFDKNFITIHFTSVSS